MQRAQGFCSAFPPVISMQGSVVTDHELSFHETCVADRLGPLYFFIENKQTNKKPHKDKSKKKYSMMM